MTLHRSLLIAALLAWSASSHACDLSADKVSKTMGVKATATPDGVVRVGSPRKDVKVTVDGVAMHPFAGLGSWAAFQKTKHGAMVMGDTVLFQDEINPAIDAAFEHGLEVTGLHNHFLFDEPKVYFMHIGGEGCPDKLAQGVRAIWDAVKHVRTSHGEPARSFGSHSIKAGSLDADGLARIVGEKAASEGGIVKFTTGRKAQMHDVSFGGSLGLTTWAAFSGSDASAAIDGDFAMTAGEVQPVLRALRKHGINIVALHNHMVGESPAYFFVHFWAKGEADELAQGFKDALAAQSQADQPAAEAPSQGKKL